MAVAVLAMIFAVWARFHFTTARVKNDPTSESNLQTAKASAQPLLDALEKYRGDNGLYPATLDQLSSDPLKGGPSNEKYLTSPVGPHSYRYSARQNDWVYKSDECRAREKSLHGWILKETSEYNKEVTDFKQECLSGYRYYQLQSRDFPSDPQSRFIDRWAYYDSSLRQWSVGWCSHDPSSHGHSQETAENGVCRWWQRNHSDPW
jgi:hypothetical protein